MILTYLYSLDELNKMGDGIILSLEDYSFSHKKMFNVDEIIDIKNKTTKPLFLAISPLYHDNELEKIEEKIKELKDIDFFIFQDLGLVSIFTELGILDKAIYAPETFITNHIDREFYKKSGINSFLISREITLNDIKKILERKEDSKYLYSIYGYQMIFYSFRKHFLNFNEHYNSSLDLSNKFDIYLKEETRNSFYPTIEDNRGFRIYRDKVQNGFEYINELSKMDYFILDRVFVNDKEYFDTISLYKGEMSPSEYIQKYGKFNTGYFFNEVGLLKEDSL